MAFALAQTAPNLAPDPNPAAPDQIPVNSDPQASLQKIEGWIDGFFYLLPNLGVALLVLLVIFLIGTGLGWIVRRWGQRRHNDDLGRVLGSFVKWLVGIFGLLVAATIIFPSVKPVDLLAGLGLGSVAIGFAFKDILQNWLAGLLILLRKPFHVGDQIVYESFEGTVDRIETRAVHVRTYDGRRVLIPNSALYTNAVTVNTAHPVRRSEYDIGIGYGDDIDAAVRIIEKTLAGVEGVEADPTPEALPWELAGSSVAIRARWWTDSRRVRVVHVKARVILAVKRALDEAGIDMPYETRVLLWHDQTEEIDGIRGKQREGWPQPKQGPNPRPAREAMAEAEENSR